MPFIEYPNVPNVPGVPAVNRLPADAGDGLYSMPSLSPVDAAGSVIAEAWGIYNTDTGAEIGGSSDVIPNISEIILSTASVEYRKECQVADFPVEGGYFASYNKVELPANPQVTLIYDATINDRSAFLNAVDEACKSTDGYDVVTPEQSYINYSIERYSYSRTQSKGAHLLIVELSLKEIRTVDAQYTTANTNTPAPQSVNAAPQVDSGKVQAQPPQSFLKQGAGVFK